MQEAELNARQKYSEAISLYSSSGLSVKDICEKTGVGIYAFSSYLSRYHRGLILKRHNLTNTPDVRLRGVKGQTTQSYHKYKEAISACERPEYLEYNISQIARIFEVDCSSLANQLRRHYSDIIPRREMARSQMGISINLQYGVRAKSSKTYSKAIEMLQSSDLTIEEAANACDVSYTGLREHISAYHPKLSEQRELKRLNQKSKNAQPKQRTVEKYKDAVAIYRKTSLEVKEIAQICSVSLGGLRNYLRRWHEDLIVQRRGYEGVELENTKRYNKATAEKYAPVIASLKTTNQSITKAANNFGLNPDTLRRYIKQHYPEILTKRSEI